MLVEFTFKGGIKQIKKVMPHEIYLEIKRLRTLIENDLTVNKLQCKNELDSLLKPYNDHQWCTDQSPLGLAINTGLLILPSQQGGTHEVGIKILET